MPKKRMKLQHMYADQPALFQLLILLILMFFGACLVSAGGAMILSAPQVGTTTAQLRIVQFISSICIFLLPAIGAGYLFSDNTRAYLSAEKLPNASILLLVAGSVLLVTPVISVTTILNQQMELPAFMRGIESWMRAQEKEMETITKLLLQEKGTAVLLANLFVVAVCAGITEEVLFRGALQRILAKGFRNPHVVIWGVAFIFSAFHMQFYGLIPRMLLGAYFGYLLYWSKSIYLPIAAHFLNNAMGVFMMSNQQLSENKILSEQAVMSDVLPIALICLPLFIMVAWKIRKMSC